MVLARTLVALLAVVALASASIAQEEAPAPPELSTLPYSRPFPGCRTVRFVLPDGTPAADAEVWIARVVRGWARAPDPLDVGWASILRLAWSDAELVAVDDPYGAVDVERLAHVADAHGRVHVPRGVDHQKLWMRLFRAGREYRGYADLAYWYDEQPLIELT